MPASASASSDATSAAVSASHIPSGSRPAVRRVALARDAFVPVVKRGGGILNFDRFEPRVLARWLIEVTVDAKISFSHRVSPSWDKGCALHGKRRSQTTGPVRAFLIL